MFLAFRRHHALRLAIFGAAFMVLNLITLRYLAMDDIDQVDIALVGGHHIAIDPGHGGIDNGASGNGIIEKDLNLAIALKVADVLKNNGAIVTMTREDDSDFYTKGKGGKRHDLMQRVSQLETSDAEVFVSLHANAIQGGQWSGSQVFYGGKHPDSKILGELVQRALRDFPPGNKRQAKLDNDILVLNAHQRPGVLVETGFLTNTREAVLLKDSEYQQKMAEQIAKALAYFFSQKVGR